MGRLIAILMSDDLVILFAFLIIAALYLFAIATICRCLFAFVEEASGPDSRRAQAHRRRKDLRRSLGRG
jgi:hypothetical protein